MAGHFDRPYSRLSLCVTITNLFLDTKINIKRKKINKNDNKINKIYLDNTVMKKKNAAVENEIETVNLKHE